MNTLSCYVIKILGEPEEMYGKWWLEVEYVRYGIPSVTRIMLNTKEEAESVTKGYRF